MADDDPSKISYSVLYLTADATTRTYTNWQVAKLGATPIPGLSVESAPNTGTMTDKNTTVEFLTGADAWLDSLVQGDFVRVDLRLIVVTEGIGPAASGGTQTSNQGYYRLVRSTRNPEGQKGLGRLEFLSCKQRLTMPLGISATPACSWTLGDKTCQVTVVEDTALVSSIDRDTITISAALTAPDLGYWHRGTASYGGVTIGIRGFDANIDDTLFYLVQPPPASWAGQVVTFRPGCDKSAGVCENRWANLDRFGGFGIAIPNYHPVTEIPS